MYEDIKYTYEEMAVFFSLYIDSKTANLDRFEIAMKKLGVPESEARLIWQAFDLATEEVWIYFRDRVPWTLMRIN
jgi:hypothetical protein